MNKFRRIAVLVMVALLGVTVANAQFRYGVKAGLNLNKLHLSNNAEDFEATNGLGWNAGAIVEFKVPIVGLNLDASLLFARMNSHITAVEGTGADATGFNNVSRNFLEIPVNVKYKFSLPVVGHWFSPYVFTGPDFAFKFGKNEDLHTFQFGWNVGVGFEIIKHLQLSGGYSFGCNNIAEKFTDKAGAQVKVKNNYWTISAAYLF